MERSRKKEVTTNWPAWAGGTRRCSNFRPPVTGRQAVVLQAMPPDTHIEMLNADAERQPEPSKETGPNLETLSLAAADLGRRLVWLPGTRSSRFFSERYRALGGAIRPV